MSGMGEAILDLPRIPEVLGLPVSPQLSPNPARQSSKAVFLSPELIVDVVDVLHALEYKVRDDWDELPVDTRKRLWRGVEALIESSLKVTQDSEPRSKSQITWRKAAIFLSIAWACIKSRRDLLKEFTENLNSLVDAVLERVASEPFNEIEEDAQLTIRLKTGESKQVLWKDIDTFLEVNHDQVEYYNNPGQPPRRSSRTA